MNVKITNKNKITLYNNTNTNNNINITEYFLKNNPFLMQTTYTKEDVKLFHKKSKESKPSEKYRKPLPCDKCVFPYEDYIDLNVKGYNKSTIKIKTFCNYDPKVTPKAALILFHGFGSHSGRQTHFAEYFAKKGLFVCSMDFREHGLTE